MPRERIEGSRSRLRGFQSFTIEPRTPFPAESEVYERKNVKASTKKLGRIAAETSCWTFRNRVGRAHHVYVGSDEANSTDRLRTADDAGARDQGPLPTSSNPGAQETDDDPSEPAGTRREANRRAAMRELEQLRRCGFDLSRLEPFVSADVVGLFLDMNPACVVRDAAAGLIPAYPLRVNGQRTHWRFLLSEVQASMLARRRKEMSSNVRIQATAGRKASIRKPRVQ